MNQYEPSIELINILIEHGFVEDTQTSFPEHADRLKSQPYDPNGIKRHFKYTGTREQLFFDYINIKIPGGGSRYSLSAEELRSLIAFCRLSLAERRALRKERRNALSLPDIRADVERAPMVYSKAVYKRAVLAFKALAYIN